MKVDWTNNRLIQKELLRGDTENIFVPGISAKEFSRIMIDYLLGEDWYVSDPLGAEQILYIAADHILNKYSKRYRKEVKQYNKEYDHCKEGLDICNILESKKVTIDCLKNELLSRRPELKK